MPYAAFRQTSLSSHYMVPHSCFLVPKFNKSYPQGVWKCSPNCVKVVKVVKSCQKLSKVVKSCQKLWIVCGNVAWFGMVGRKRLYERKEVMVWSLRSAHWLTNKGRYRAARAAKKQQTTKQQQQQQNNNNKTITTNKNNNNKTRYSTKTTFVKNFVRHCTLWKRLCHNWESSQVGQVGRSGSLYVREVGQVDRSGK